MSKVDKLVSRANELPFATKSEAVVHAEFVLTGKRTLSREQATKLFGEAADALDVNFTRFGTNMKALIAAELAMAEHVRTLAIKAKNHAAAVGDAMARIDKVVVRDFEVKLSQLERFVAALSTLDELKRNGRLPALLASLGGAP